MFAGVYVTFSVYSAVNDLGEYFDNVINETNKSVLVTALGFLGRAIKKDVNQSEGFFFK